MRGASLGNQIGTDRDRTMARRLIKQHNCRHKYTETINYCHIWRTIKLLCRKLHFTWGAGISSKEMHCTSCSENSFHILPWCWAGLPNLTRSSFLPRRHKTSFSIHKTKKLAVQSNTIITLQFRPFHHTLKYVSQKELCRSPTFTNKQTTTKKPYI